MILCLDVGNTQIYGGVYEEGQLRMNFRHDSRAANSSDQLGIFFKQVLRENGLDCDKIQQIGISSVVPHHDYSLRSACIKYFGVEPFFLQADNQNQLVIENNPELGADRIANAIAAVAAHPNQNVIVIDFGTATTYCAISADKKYLGGLILAGIRLSMSALQNNTAKLFPVEILKPDSVVGKTTKGHIQAGLYYSQLGAMQLITQNLMQECFPGQTAVIVGTGGFAYLFEQENLFTTINPNLVLQGIQLALAAADQPA